jgi:signal-transduction protein with cAMP-binding, CBS, and nucleotidyltransferase domain
MEQFISLELQTQLQDVKLKKQQANVDDLLEKLQKPDSSSLKEGFGGWIDLLKRFLMKQYPDTYQEYEKVLHDLKLV